MPTNGQLLNYIKGEWRRSTASEYLEVTFLLQIRI